MVTGFFITVAVNIRPLLLPLKAKAIHPKGGVRRHGQGPCLGLASARSAV